MIPGVAFDDTALSTSAQEVKPTADISDDSKNQGQSWQSSTYATNAHANFGDRFSPESALTVLDAQERQPFPTRTEPTASAEDTQESSNDEECNPLDTNGDGMVSFAEWLNRDEATAEASGSGAGTTTDRETNSQDSSR